MDDQEIQHALCLKKRKSIRSKRSLQPDCKEGTRIKKKAAGRTPAKQPQEAETARPRSKVQRQAIRLSSTSDITEYAR